MQRLFLLLIGSLLVLAGTGCNSSPIPTIHKIDIRQGNYIDEDMVAQLEPGMTRRQVQFLLGTPLINHPFHQDRWDYVYSFEPGTGTPVQRHITLFFEHDRLTRIIPDPGIQHAFAEREDWVRVSPQVWSATPAPEQAASTPIQPPPTAPDTDTAPSTQPEPSPSLERTAPSGSEYDDAYYQEVETQLKQLTRLRDLDLITEEEYQERRRIIVSDL